MIDQLIGVVREFLTPNVGVIALVVLAAGIAIAIAIRVMSKVGSVLVFVGIGVLVVVSWAGRRFVTTPSWIVSAKIDQEKSAFEKRYEETRLHPLYEVEVTDEGAGRFTIVRYEIRRDRLEEIDSEHDYLVKTAYKCHISNPVHARCDTKTITAYDKRMCIIGRPAQSSGRYSFDLRSDESYGFDKLHLVDDLVDGTLALPWHDQSIDAHFRELKRYLAEQKRRAADYVRRITDEG